MLATTWFASVVTGGLLDVSVHDAAQLGAGRRPDQTQLGQLALERIGVRRGPSGRLDRELRPTYAMRAGGGSVGVGRER